MDNKATVKVLILAGGGIFGVIPARLIAALNLKKPFIECMDCMGGTSIGGILSLMYAHDKNPQEVYSLFKEMGKKVFNPPFWRNLNPFCAKHDASKLEKILQKEIPKKFGELKKFLVIPSLDYQFRKYKVYDNIYQTDDVDMDCWKIGRATSSAQTYFAPYDCVTEAMLDGGQVENIPILTTCTALKHKLNIDFKDMSVFAIGTGYTEHKKINLRKLLRRTLIQWVRPTIKMVTEANEMASVFWAKRLDLKYFHFFNPVKLDLNWNMDEANLMNVVLNRTEPHIHKFEEEFNKWLET